MAFRQRKLRSSSPRPLGQQKRVWRCGQDCPPLLGPTVLTHHISMGVEYSVDPSSTSGGLYHRVTTSLE